MKKRTLYILSFISPMILFFLISSLCGYIPFGKYSFNLYDAYYEYPTFLVELGRMLRSGQSIFYTLHAGMGVNFFSILNLYGGSPLNIFSIFFNNTNIIIFYTLLIYIKIGLSGLTMYLYLNSLNTKYIDTIWNLLFSLIYALSGWVIAMNMHIMWLDAYILLPLIIKGLDKLILKNQLLEYTLFLALAIIINYYTGFMLCLFMIIYFVYKTLITNSFNKKTILRFIGASLLAALISSVILIPTIFNLMTGRFSDLDFSFNYFSLDQFTLFSSLYNMTIGSFILEDHLDYGSTTLYITIFCLVLIIVYFFNQNISRKNKIITLLTLLFFHLCFSFPLLDYAWNMLQKPIWWEHRYQFVYIFFSILIAYQSFTESESLKLSVKQKSMITIIFMVLLILSFSYKVMGLELSNTRVLMVFLSIILFYIHIRSSKSHKYFIFLIIGELILNSSFILNINKGLNYEELVTNNKKENDILEDIKDEDYRITTLSYSDAGLMFGFNSLEIFSSSNNIQVTKFLSQLNITRYNLNSILLYSYNPAVFSLLGVKYIIGNSTYFPCKDNICVNDNALPIMYGINSQIRNMSMSEDFKENINNLYSILLGEKTNIFYDLPVDIELKNVKLDKEGNFYDAQEDVIISFSTTVDKECIIFHHNNQIILQEEASVFINNEEYEFPLRSDYLIVLDKGDTLTVTYKYDSLSEDASGLNEYLFSALDSRIYEDAIKKIKEKTSYTSLTNNDSILKAKVKTEEDVLLISIPYDKGLHIEIDGKEVNYFRVLETLVGIDIESGTHVVEITYEPQGLKCGLFLSLISLLVTFLIAYISKRKKIDQTN